MIMITVDRARRVEQYKCVKLWMDHHLPIQTIYGLIIRHLSSQLTLANETEAWIRHTDCVEPNIIAAQPKFHWKMTSFCGKLIAIRLYFILKNVSLYVYPALPWHKSHMKIVIFDVLSKHCFFALYVFRQTGESICFVLFTLSKAPMSLLCHTVKSVWIAYFIVICIDEIL